MAVSNFEGVEKRLELRFSGSMDDLGLRRIDFLRLKAVLDEVQCSVVSAMSNWSFDAYVLSESSLFLYSEKIIIKTCGTTQLLKSVTSILSLAGELGMDAVWCRYTRGSFIFPDAQPFPHTSFEEEVEYLQWSLPVQLLRHKKACVLKPSMATHPHEWHVFTAMASGCRSPELLRKFFTLEICMTELDRACAKTFFRMAGDMRSGDAAGKEMTAFTGIGSIHPESIICDYAFDPCGYSMNAIIDGAGTQYSTIHVTPEEGFSYASFEYTAHTDVSGMEDVVAVIKKVVGIFRPACMTVALAMEASVCVDDQREVVTGVAAALGVVGMEGEDFLVELDLQGRQRMTFQSFRMVDRPC